MTLDQHQLAMLAHGLVSRRASELHRLIAHELKSELRELLSITREFSCRTMRRVWSAPWADEPVEPEHAERRMLGMDKGRISLPRLDSGCVMSWACISSGSVWTDAFGPLRSSERLQIGGGVPFAPALLNALVARS